MRAEVRAVIPEYPLQGMDGIPHRQRYDRKIRFPVVYLLHGYTGDYTDWMNMIPIERYANKYGIAVVMPNGMNSWYLDLPNGVLMEQYIAEELPAMMEAYLPVSDNADQRFIAGLSMGGVGAVRTALRHPKTYRAVSSMSSGLDIVARLNMSPETPYLERVRRSVAFAYGGLEHLSDPSLDIKQLYIALREAGEHIPPLLFQYGVDDPSYPVQYPSFVKFARDHGLPVKAAATPGAHDFECWDISINNALDWFRDMLNYAR